MIKKGGQEEFRERIGEKARRTMIITVSGEDLSSLVDQFYGVLWQ